MSSSYRSCQILSVGVVLFALLLMMQLRSGSWRGARSFVNFDTIFRHQISDPGQTTEPVQDVSESVVPADVGNPKNESSGMLTSQGGHPFLR